MSWFMIWLTIWLWCFCGLTCVFNSKKFEQIQEQMHVKIVSQNHEQIVSQVLMIWLMILGVPGHR